MVRWWEKERKWFFVLFLLFHLSQVQIREKWLALAAKGVIKGLHIFCPVELLKFSFKVRNFSDGWL